MCGIAGIWELQVEAEHSRPLEVEVREMAANLAHRGPDDAGEWHDPAAGIALGHRRLSVLDLSVEGRQPMISSGGRLVMAYNGEIYNYRDLRVELEGVGRTFRGTSDTEIALAAIEEWGFDAAIGRFNGMFAIAVWDRSRHVLSLARDRLGIKPLYFGWVGKRFVFSSELKAVTGLGGFTGEIDSDAAAAFFRFGFVPSPLCIYRGINALRPATVVHLDRAGFERREPEESMYWQPVSGRERLPLTPAEGDAELDRLLRDSVRLRMAADVPLGAFLSGGIDSSLVVAMLQAEARRPIRTFTIGFREEGYDEAPYASAIAKHLGTEHTEVYVSGREAMDVIPKLPEIWDEPFADSSQIPTYLVSQIARSQVTVALSGDGGDELFGGYTRYAQIAADWRRSRRVPAFLRRRFGTGAEWLISRGGRWMTSPLALMLRVAGKPTANLSERLLWRMGAWQQDDLAAFYDRHAAHAVNPRIAAFFSRDFDPGPGRGGVSVPEAANVVEKMMFLDLGQYLPDDILTKVDRASMAVSLEARVPLLDHRVVEFAQQLPYSHRVGHAGTKASLKRVLGRYLPEELTQRPKMGFGIPYGEWMRGPLRGWAEDLLEPSRLGESGLFDVAWIRARWQEHIGETYDHRNLFWPVLIFESWRRHWKAC